MKSFSHEKRRKTRSEVLCVGLFSILFTSSSYSPSQLLFNNVSESENLVISLSLNIYIQLVRSSSWHTKNDKLAKASTKNLIVMD